MRFSRRDILNLSILASIWFPLSRVFAANEKAAPSEKDGFPLTVAVLKEAFVVETMANRHYVGFAHNALKERYPNIAYMFIAFSESEKIHANNYRSILLPLGESPKEPGTQITVSDTRDNLRTAAKNELEKIKHTYPEYLKRLQVEANEPSVVNCMYSWKSHQQHEEEIKKIIRYSGLFFDQVAKKIEGGNPDYFVCNHCGSTISEPPEIACIICNYPMKYYRRIERPSL
jgi:rubrerythrin